MGLMRIINKPEYFFNPSQLYKRAKLVFNKPQSGSMKFQLPWGAEVEARVGETIGDSLLVLGIYDLVVSEAIFRLIGPGDSVCDVGANIGVMTSLMASRVSSPECVYAFEAHPLIYEKLKNNLSYAKDRVQLVNQAVSNETGSISLNIPKDFETNQGLAFVSKGKRDENSIQIPATTLDSFFSDKKPPAFMKIDVENHELEVLQGAEKSLKFIKNIIFEDHHPYPSKTMSYLEGKGFTVFKIKKTFWGPKLDSPKSPQTNNWESPSYLATQAPKEVMSAMNHSGWQVLSNLKSTSK